MWVLNYAGSARAAAACPARIEISTTPFTVGRDGADLPLLGISPCSLGAGTDLRGQLISRRH